jgi:hypothetical protein
MMRGMSTEIPTQQVPIELPVVTNVSYPRGAPLPCPGCGESNLHHEVVATYTGSSEDSPGSQLTEVSNRGTTVTEVSRPAHQGRRNACLIHFRCEGCGRNPVLRIMQHKGSTFLEWMPERFERRPHPGD